MPNVRGKFATKLPSWRKIAAIAWKPPDDATIYGSLDIDVSKALPYLEEVSKKSGQKLTVTHLAVAAAARALRKHPECNGYIRGGRVFLRDDVDVFVHVAVPPKDGEGGGKADLTGLKIQGADQKGVGEIATEIGKGASKVRKGNDKQLKGAKDFFDNFSPQLLGAILRGVSHVQYEWNVDLSRLGFPRDPFGSAMVTSVGMFGITEGFAPITPFTRTTVLLLLGALQDKPVVIDGQVAVRPILRVTGTFDHRLIDGFQAGKFGATFKEIMEDPAAKLA